MADIAYEILMSKNEPTYYKDIWKIMEQDVGYKSNSSTPEASLNSVLGRDSRFFKHQGIVQLVEWHSEEDDDNLTFEAECPKCGELFDSNFNFCPNCGSKIKLEIICPFCENTLNKYKEHWGFCGNCGKQLPEDLTYTIEAE